MPKWSSPTSRSPSSSAADQGLARFSYIGSDPEKHHFLDDSRPKVLRIFLLDRKEWQPPRVVDVEDDLATPVAFRDGKLVCLEPDKIGQADPGSRGAGNPD